MESMNYFNDDANREYSQTFKTFNKKPSSFREQIEKLESRGMLFADKDTAFFLLQHINYYRLEAYWFTYYDSKEQDHRFLADTNFSNIWRDYSFDRKLRAHILRGLERIEVSFRTQFTYFLAHKYGGFPFKREYFYFDETTWDENHDALKKICRESGKQFATHLRSCYGLEIFPIWALTELLSFGKTVVFYKKLKDSTLKKQISRVYGIEPQILDSWLDHLYSVRNLCAHHARLWNRRFVKTPKESKNIRQDIGSRWLSQLQEPREDDPRNERRIYNTLLIVDYLLSNICPKNSWKKDLVNLILEYGIDTKRMGFPDNWTEDAYWICD